MGLKVNDKTKNVNTDLMYKDLIKKIKSYNPDVDETLLDKAYLTSKKYHKDQYRKTGEPFIIHPLEVARILADIELDHVSTAAAILHDVIEDTQYSLEMAKKAVKAGCIVIDNSSAWRMDPSVPLVVPEVNPQDIEKHEGIIANPNCSTIQLMLPLKLIHEAAKIKRLVISTYQAVSGTGVNAIQECLKQSLEVSQGKNISDALVYPHQIAFNALPHIDDFTDNGYTKEEMKLVHETRKILGDSSIKITATAVRVPVIYGHSESVNIETEKNISPSAVRELLKGKPGIVVLDEPDKNIYPMPIDAAGKDDIFVGRIRKDESIDNGINMWVVSDNIRKGAALNTIQIGELLIKKGLI